MSPESLSRFRELKSRVDSSRVRILCVDDRRGIYTELTAAGQELHDRARPVHDATLERVLADAAAQPELAPMVDALHGEPATR